MRKLSAALALACTSLSMLAACQSSTAPLASQDPRQPDRWRVEPILTVVHNNPTLARNLYAMGRYHDGMRQFDRAVDAYQRAIMADPTYVEAHNALGATLATKGRLDDAEAALRKALALDGRLAHVQSNLGYLLLLAGKHEAAVAALKIAVRLDPDNATSRKNLREALKQWDLARGREPQDGASATSVASASLATEVVLDAEQVHASEAAPVPYSVEVPLPTTTASVNLPATSTVAQRAQPSTTIALLPSDPSSLESAAAVTQTPVTPIAKPSRSATVPALNVTSRPNLAPMTQVVSHPTVRLAVPAGLSLGNAAVIRVPKSGAEPATLPATSPVTAPANDQTVAPSSKLPIWRESFSLEIHQPDSSRLEHRADQLLIKRGLITERLTLRRGVGNASSVVWYQAGHRADAERVAAMLGVKAAQVRWSAQRVMDHDVSVVLAHDWAAHAGLGKSARTVAWVR